MALTPGAPSPKASSRGFLRGGDTRLAPGTTPPRRSFLEVIECAL
jgi:hypothetical protein